MRAARATRTLFWAIFGFLSFPLFASAHEAYVLPQQFFWQEISNPINPRALSALQNPHDLWVTLEITAAILALIALNFLFRQSAVGERANRFFERFSNLGPVFVRVAIAFAFFFGARSGAFLGPELSLAQMPFAETLRWGLYLASGMILTGLFTELAAVIGFAIFSLGFFSFGAYLATYLNYLGELIVLILFGMRRWSLDAIFFGPLTQWRARWEPYETTIVRVFYGIALIYAGVTVKFLHPDLTLRVVNDWNLTRFHWLFPSDPLLVVLGAGLAEAAIGLFLIVGFEMRMTVLISLFYITLSLLYFRELVWPHILLYGISFNLLVQPEILTIDHFLFERHRKAGTVWRRLLFPHRASRKP